MDKFHLNEKSSWLLASHGLAGGGGNLLWAYSEVALKLSTFVSYRLAASIRAVSVEKAKSCASKSFEISGFNFRAKA